jgi:Na+/proline symporter
MVRSVSRSGRISVFVAVAVAFGLASGLVAARHLFNGDYSSPPHSRTPAFATRVSYHWTEGFVVALLVAAIAFGLLLLIDRASVRAGGVQPSRKHRSSISNP